MIAVKDLIRQMKSSLDAHGTDYYNVEDDYVPALIDAQQWVVSLLNQAFSRTKLSPEGLRWLKKSSVFQTSRYSRVALPADLWTIVSVYPAIEWEPSNHTPEDLSEAEESKLMIDLTMTRPTGGSAKRLTEEEWSQVSTNPFASGSSVLCSSLSGYSYRELASYNSSTYQANGLEIEISPASPSQFVGITWIKNPVKPTGEDDYMDFPESLSKVLVDKALNFISRQQEDRTSIFEITQQELGAIVNLIR